MSKMLAASVAIAAAARAAAHAAGINCLVPAIRYAVEAAILERV